MAKRSAKQHRRDVKKTMKGGEGTSDNAIRVFGGMNEQHAVSATDNTIAMNSPAAAPAMQGGDVTGDLAKLQAHINNEVNKLKKEGGEEVQQKMAEFNDAVQNGGTGVLENIAVPAILLYANQRYSNKKRFAHGKAKLRRTSRRVSKMRK